MTARTKLGFEEKKTKQGEKVRKEPKERRVGFEERADPVPGCHERLSLPSSLLPCSWYSNIPYV